MALPEVAAREIERSAARRRDGPPWSSRRVDPPVCGHTRRVLQLCDLPRAAPSTARTRIGRRAIPRRLRHGRVDADRRLREAARRCPVGPSRPAPPAPRRRHRVRDHAVHASRGFDAGSAHPAAVSRQRDSHLRARGVGQPFRYRTAGKPRRVAGACSTAQGAGQALGPVVAGYLIAAGRFDLAFLTAGVIGLGVPLIVAGWRVAPATSSRRWSWGEFKQGVMEVGRDRLVLVTSGAQAAQFVLNGTLNAFLPLYGREALGLTATQLGWLFGIQTLTTLAVRPAIGLLSDRAGRRWVIVTGLTICSTAVFSLSLATTAAALVVAVIGYAAGVATTTAATSAFITDVTRRARYGAAHGVFGTIYDVGDALGPIVAGLLVVAVGYARMFQIMAAVALTMAITFSLAARSRTSTV